MAGKAKQNSKGQWISESIGQPLADRPIPVRLPADIDAIVREMPNRSAWIREAIIEKLKRENQKHS